MSKKRKVENVEGVVWGEAVENEAKKINNFLSSQSEKQIEKTVQSKLMVLTGTSWMAHLLLKELVNNSVELGMDMEDMKEWVEWPGYEDDHDQSAIESQNAAVEIEGGQKPKIEILKYDKGKKGKRKDPKQRTLDQFLFLKPSKQHKASPELKADHPGGGVVPWSEEVPWLDEAQLEKEFRLDVTRRLKLTHRQGKRLELVDEERVAGTAQDRHEKQLDRSIYLDSEAKMRTTRTEESDEGQLMPSVSAISKVILFESPHTRKASVKTETVAQLISKFGKSTHFAQSSESSTFTPKRKVPPILCELEVEPITTPDRSRQCQCSSTVGSPAKRLRR